MACHLSILLLILVERIRMSLPFCTLNYRFWTSTKTAIRMFWLDDLVTECTMVSLENVKTGSQEWTTTPPRSWTGSPSAGRTRCTGSCSCVATRKNYIMIILIQMCCTITKKEMTLQVQYSWHSVMQLLHALCNKVRVKICSTTANLSEP